MYQDFPIYEFLYTPWARYYNENSRLVSFFGLARSLLVAFCWKLIKKKMIEKRGTLSGL